MSRTLNDATRRRMGIVANIAALTVAFIIGLVLIGVSIWGFWICQGFANSSDDRALGASAPIFVKVRFALSWLVLFMPFAITGILVLRSTLRQAFGKRDETWIYPFRVFMAVVEMRIVAEHQEKGKSLPAESEKLLEGFIEPEK